MAIIPFLNNAYFAAKVGIGTESPLTNLDILGTSDTYVTIRNTGGGHKAGILMYGGSAGISHIWHDDADANPPGIRFGTSANVATAPTTQMYIEGGSGNVGIGTASPAVKLDVNGGGRFNTTTGATPFYITRNGANDQALKVHVDDQNVVFESIQDETADDYGGFVFNMDAGTTEPYFDVRKNNSTIMRVDGNGNVGIGTTAPIVKLDVVGTARFADVSPRIVLQETGTAKDFSLKINTILYPF